MVEKNKPAKAAASGSSSGSKAEGAPEKSVKTVKIVKGDTGGNKAIITRKARSDGDTAVSPDAKAKSLRVVPTSQRAGLVAQTAYFIAEKRNFCGRDDLADWLEAERQVDETYLFT